jgi:hypothetical protein
VPPPAASPGGYPGIDLDLFAARQPEQTADLDRLATVADEQLAAARNRTLVDARHAGFADVAAGQQPDRHNPAARLLMFFNDRGPVALLTICVVTLSRQFPRPEVSEPEDIMIDAQLLRKEGILVVAPVDSLQKADFERLRLLVDPYIEKHGGLTGLLIDAETFFGWDDFPGMLSHIRFAQNYQKNIARVAAVTDNSFLAILPTVADHFTDAEVRHFEYQDRDKALEWLRSGRIAAD